MASNGFKKLMLGMEELGEMLNQGDEYFNTLYDGISKDELDNYRNEHISEDLTETLEDYKLTYYLATATADRRPETIEDVENDWIEETFAADSDYDACKYAFSIINDIVEEDVDEYLADYDIKDVTEFVEYCENKDLGDGSPFVIKLEGPNGVIYDWGYDKQSYIDEFVSEDSYEDDEFDEFDESLEESLRNPKPSMFKRLCNSKDKDLCQKACEIMYDWYYNEDAFDDFSTVSEFIDYVSDDIYNMIDAASDEEEIEIVLAALSSSNQDMNDLINFIENNLDKVFDYFEVSNLEELLDNAYLDEISEELTILYEKSTGEEVPFSQSISFFRRPFKKFLKTRGITKIDESLNEGRNNPYFTPYGYRDAAKVLNRTAPEYYWHLKEIEMDRGDGIKLANYAFKKGLPVMLDKHSDPDYPEFYLKDGSSEYHWGDYFYTYGFTNPDAIQLVPYEGNLDILNTEKDDNKMNESKNLNESTGQYILFGFNHFSPEYLWEIKDSKENLETLISTYGGEGPLEYNAIIEDKGTLLFVEHNDEFISVVDTGYKTIEDFKKALYNTLDPMIQQDLEDGYEEGEYEFDIAPYYLFIDELTTTQAAVDYAMELIENSYVDGDSGSEYRFVDPKTITDNADVAREGLGNVEDQAWDDSWEDDYDDDTDFDIDESHENRLMDSLYEGSDDFDDYDDTEIIEDDDLNLLETNKGSIEVFDWDFSNIYDNEIMIETDLGISTIKINIEDLDSLLPNKKIFASDEHYINNNTGIKWVKLTEYQIEFIKEAIEENLEDYDDLEDNDFNESLNEKMDKKASDDYYN